MNLPRHAGRYGMLAAKLLVLAAVAWGVTHTLGHGWRQLGQQQWQIHWPWLAAAGGLYILGLLPPAWFWWQVLRALGGTTDWFHTLAAYMFGHLGKYVPGKGLVVILRAASLPRESVSLMAAVVSVFLETLTLMAAGALLAAVLWLWVVGWDNRTVGIALVVLVVVGVPTIPPVVRYIVQWMASRRMASLAQSSHTDTDPGDAILGRDISWRLMACGWMAATISWSLLGASLWAVMRSLGSVIEVPLTELPLLVAAVSLATVAGFLSLIPGGLGVREGLLVITLAPKFGDAAALLATVLLRLVWIISEVGLCGILYAVRRTEDSGVEGRGSGIRGGR